MHTAFSSRPLIVAALFCIGLLPAAAADASLRYFVTQSASMAPTIVSGQLLGVDPNYYKTHAVKAGDVIVFSPPIATDIPYVKRVVAVPGDRLSITNGTVVRNGTPTTMSLPATPYDLSIHDYRMFVDDVPLQAGKSFIPAQSAWTSEDRVPNGCYVVLGDNRRISNDSHIWGFLCPGRPGLPGSQPSIEGRVLTKMVPV